MTDSLQLFDPSVYGPGKKPRSRTSSSGDATTRIEAHQEPWLLIRDRQGVKPYFHIVRTRADSGAVVTVCGIIGNQISNVGVDQMIRCPGCDVGIQIDQLALL